jgi:hypothetical protein
MARSVDEVNITNWVNTGQTRQMARYTFTLEIKWTDDQGVQHVHGPQIYDFPTDLTAMPLAVRRRFANEMIIATARVALGIDTWEQYE